MRTIEQELEARVQNSSLWKNAEMSWHEFKGNVHPIIVSSDIPNFRSWLFLNGFRKPIGIHDAFDFSAYKTKEDGLMLGLPEETPVYSPLDGHIAQATALLPALDGTLATIHEHYQSFVVIQHNTGARMSTLVGHVIPTVKTRDFVRKGQKIGVIFSNLGNYFGTLPHAHVCLGEYFPGNHVRLLDSVDPITIFLKGQTLERLNLPHKGPFHRDELAEAGITTRYDALEYYQAD